MDIAILAHEETSGTDSGGILAGAKRTRTINTELADPNNMVSISANQFTLAAGKYIIRAKSGTHFISVGRAYIVNVTDSTVVGAGNNMAAATLDKCPYMFVAGYADISSAKAFEIQMQVRTTRNFDGLGEEVVMGDNEVYCKLLISRVG